MREHFDAGQWARESESNNDNKSVEDGPQKVNHQLRADGFIVPSRTYRSPTCLGRLFSKGKEKAHDQ